MIFNLLYSQQNYTNALLCMHYITLLHNTLIINGLKNAHVLFEAIRKIMLKQANHVFEGL